MNLKEKLEKYIHEETNDGFHDSSLLNIEIIPRLNKVQLSIKHMRIIGKDKFYLVTVMKFQNISNIKLENMERIENQFGVDDDVGDFDVSNINEGVLIKITGSKGWVFSFIADDCDINEYRFDEEK